MNNSNALPWMQTKHFKNFLDECKACTSCKLHTLRQGDPVIYRGNRRAKVMLIGEAPGENEEIAGVPFTGKAGKLLAKCFKWINYNIDDIYITNAAKCRPAAPLNSGKKNITPDISDIRTCTSKFLNKEITELDPELIIATGKSSAVALNILKSSDPATPNFNKFFTTTVNNKTYPVLFIRHPASLLYPKSAEEKEMIRQEYLETWDIIQEKMDVIIHE